MNRRPSELRRLAVCAALTVALHAAVLALPMRPVAVRGEGPPVRTIELVRYAPSSAIALSIPTPVPEHALAGAPHDALAAAAPEAQPAPLPTAAPSPIADPASDKAAARDAKYAAEAASPAGVAAALAGWALPGAAGEDDAFLARSLLTLPPQPLGPVIIPDSDGVAPGERYRGELTLFIDESGTVVRVRAETDDLPAELEDAARRAFMAVRFAPGELADLGAVKSRMRVEVVFDGGARTL